MPEYRDKAFTFIFNDILDNILQLSENPSQFADYLTQQIREVVGGRVIVVALKKEDRPCEIYSVYPARKREWAQQPVVLKLAEISCGFDSIQILDANNVSGEIASHLNQLEAEKSIIIPLVASNIRVGSMLLIDIMDFSGMEAVLDLLTRLSGIFALIVRNSVLYHNLEDEVAERTRELEKRNRELLQANQQLNETLRKVTELNIQYDEAREKAVESDRLKTAFLQNMSHEIRTPMNAIVGFSGLLLSSAHDEVKLKKFTDIIIQRCNDLLDIVSDILDIAKIESGQLPVNYGDCYLPDLFDELSLFFTEYQKRLGRGNVRFSMQSHCSPFYDHIVTDPVKLKQIFINLVSNAFKFTESGLIEGGCRLTGEDKLEFYVTDTGAGIPVDKQKSIFERFIQLHQGVKKNVGGTGLGLPIVKGLIDLLGGELVLNSEPGKGSTFSFILPVESLQKTPENNKSVFEIPRGQFQHNTVLIVEDDPFNAEYLKEALSGIGLNLLSAEYGHQALEMTSLQNIDLILMDIRLPDMNGYEVTRQVKKLYPGIKIIAQTAYALPEERRKALEAGCDDYLSKPIRREMLIAAIGKLLETEG